MQLSKEKRQKEKQ